MDYTVRYEELVSLFNPELPEIYVPGSGIKIFSTDFYSDTVSGDLFSGYDYSIKENIKFSYPVFVPADPGSEKAIILLHGLNERSWNKYLTWAYYLATETGSYVLLFPISFHINRSPVSWRDPRSMLGFLRELTASRGNVKNSSFANVALSNRLSDDPRRFVKSGFQTACDLVKLMQQIKQGEHRVVPPGSRVNLFAYSIGAFLAEIMMMANPEGLFSDSKLFMFCGGSVFSSMYGESKLIMDKLAYEKVYNYYMKEFEPELENNETVINYLASGNIGMAFRAMIDLARFRVERRAGFYRMKDQLYAIGMVKDSVIPVSGIKSTLDPGSNFDILDFPYGYSHENPFPVIKGYMSSRVDRSFDLVFEKACRFLA